MNDEKTNTTENTGASVESILALRNQVPVEKYNIVGAGTVYIHGFTGLEKAQWQEECKKKNGTVNSEMVEPLMFQMCVRDKDSKKLYKYSDIPKLKMLPAAILGEVTDVCMRLSGMGTDADEAILKNFMDEEEPADTDAS